MADLQPQTEVLVIGAGPTGLVLALWLKRLGVDVRIIDQAAKAGTTSRALVVHARTLEFYRQLGIAQEVVDKGLRFGFVNIWVRGKHVARASIADMGEGLSPFPYMLIYPQDQHESLLISCLRQAGVEVERPTQLLGFEQSDSHVTARLQRPDGVQVECRASYIAGCDGAHSMVRQGVKVGFPGGTYNRLFYVADVEFHGPTNNHELHVALDRADFLAVFPLKGNNTARLIGTVRLESEDQAQNLQWGDVSQSIVQRMGIRVDRVNWFSTYRVHHRVAEHFGRGRAFLLGDAAHIHSPVGGQGMNTGIGDAVNLAWKLAAVLRRRAAATLLETYEEERIAFARRLVATTDRAFSFASNDGPLARFVRRDAVPAVLPTVLASTAVRRFLFRTVSQTLINYRHASLSQGQAGGVRGGDRLPWVAAENVGDADNFTSLQSLGWQVHVYGAASSGLSSGCAARGVPLHEFAWTASAGGVGLARNAAYLVRPDGYVALAEPAASRDVLESYLDRHGLQLRA